MPSFIFWNVKKSPRLDLVRHLAEERTVDCIMLAECEESSTAVLNALNGEANRTYRCASKADDRVKIFTAYDHEIMVREATRIRDRVSIYRMSLPGREPFLLSALHLTPKYMGLDDDDLYAGARKALEQIELIEALRSIKRTIVVGDFNMPPFHRGMTAADGFHALMDRETTLQVSRVVGFETYKMFYNPMWSLLGDLTKGPPGSFHRLQGMVSHGWHMLDQVILRPSIIEEFDFDALAILPWPDIETYKGRPDERAGSDHFPLYFVLK